MSTYEFLGNKIVVPVIFETDELIYENDTISLKKDMLRGPSQRWKITFNIMPSGNPGALFEQMLTNWTSSFNFDIPQPNVRLNLGQRLRVTQNVTDQAGQNIVRISSSANESIPQRIFVKFSNHDKVYFLLNGYTADSGNNFVRVYPNLVQTVTPLTGMYWGDSVPMRVRFDTSILRGITFNDGLLADPGAIKLIEDLV